MVSFTSFARWRFLSGAALTAGGALLTLGAFTFSPGSERWIGFGVGAGLLAGLLGILATAGQGPIHRALDLLAALVCAWALVSARTVELAVNGAGPERVRWLGFSAGAAICGLGILSLLLHEWALERDLDWATGELVALRRDAAGLTSDHDEEAHDAHSRTAG